MYLLLICNCIEGRAVLTEHVLLDGRNLVLVNVYCPRADCDNVERLEYKLAFYNALQQRCQSLQQAGKYCVQYYNEAPFYHSVI